MLTKEEYLLPGYFLLAGFVFLLSLLQAPSARAESLVQALQRSLASNPTINAEREKLRAIDEGLDIAGAGYRPSVTLNGDVARQNTFTDSSISGHLDDTFTPRGYSVTVNQPVYRGGRTVAAVSQAEANILAGRESLRNVEQNTLLEVATAYISVVRDAAIKRLRRNNLRLLREQLEATKGRQSAGVVTSTDVALAKSRESAARSELSLADANLRTDRAEYRRLTGRSPVKLYYPAVRGKLPAASLQAALRIAKKENPSILAAFYARDAARFAVDSIRGERLPEVTLEAGYDRHWDVAGSIKEQRTANIRLRARVPLYQGGAVLARMRQANATLRQRDLEISAAVARVHSLVVSNWGAMKASQARMQATTAQIEAAEKALDGIRNEEKVGQRTVLDVLDAEQERLNAKVTAQQARGDFITAYFRLLVAMGRFNVSGGVY